MLFGIRNSEKLKKNRCYSYFRAIQISVIFKFWCNREVRRIPGIKEAAVKDFTNKAGITCLAAYYVKMDKLPVNPNGKLDRFSLPEPDITSFKNEYVAPVGSLEETICKAVESVLKCGQVGRNDDFFLLGGDSVKVVETINILGDLPVDTETFF